MSSAAEARTDPGPRDWSVRFLRNGDEPRLLSLLQSTFGTWPSIEVTVDPIEHLRWKLNSASNAAHYHMVAEARGRIVTSRLFILQQVKVDDRILRARHEVDTATHPDYQRRGIMKAMTYPTPPVLENDFDLYFALSSRHRAWSKMRAHETYPYARASLDVLVCDPGAVPPGAATHPEFVLRPVTAFDERVDAFFPEAAAPFRFAVVREREYLNWRYADPRAGRFTITIAEDSERLLGYIVARTSHGRGHIADLLVLPERKDVLDALLADALGSFAAAGVQAVDPWMPVQHRYRQALHERGFTHRRRSITAIFHPLCLKKLDLSFLNHADAQIHIMAGDTDLV